MDGLDEVAAEQRGACLDAINRFPREHGLLPMAVCSRIADYEAPGTKLRLQTAVEIQPLARTQVKGYLERVGEPLRGLRTALEEDASVWELLETPLMLWVAMLAYRDVPVASVAGATMEQQQRHLFAHFLAAMFARKPRQGIFLDSKQLAHDKQLDRFPLETSSEQPSARSVRAASVA